VLVWGLTVEMSLGEQNWLLIMREGDMAVDISQMRKL